MRSSEKLKNVLDYQRSSKTLLGMWNMNDAIRRKVGECIDVKKRMEADSVSPYFLLS